MIIDQLIFGIQAPDLTLARRQDGVGEWQVARPTPGQQNRPWNLGSTGQLRINEWLARPTTGPDWIEVFNPQTRPVSIAGLGVSDDPMNPLKSTLPPLSFIGPRSFLVLQADEQTELRGRHLGFRLNRDGEWIGISDSAGSLIDSVEFGAQSADITEGSLPDGQRFTAFFPDRGSPERANLTDSDEDGLPDTWETQHRLDPRNRNDAAEDRDGDRMSNMDEFLAGLDPNDSSSVLAIMNVERIDAGFQIRLKRIPGRRILVQASTDPTAFTWQTVAEIFGETDSPPEGDLVMDSPLDADGPRFYRLVVE